MKNLKFLVVGAVALAAAGGGIAAAATTGGSSSSYHAAAATATPAAAPATSTAAGHATVNVATATVNGQSEQILVDSAGLPLYTFSGDTATTSGVSSGLATAWPPLDSASPTESGTTGTLSVVNDSFGAQVQYAGHFLYTFTSDSAGNVTGQGVSGFAIATPTGSAAAASAPVTPAPVRSSGGYGY
jgi:predicted lipoprotein with Yx(FWY)xxD motif